MTPTFSSVRLYLPPSLSSCPFLFKQKTRGDLLPLFPTGEGQVGSWEEYESCKRCHPDLEEVMGKLLVQPQPTTSNGGKLLADLYSIEGSSLNQIVQLLPYPSKVRTVSRAKDFDLRLKNKARELPLLT